MTEQERQQDSTAPEADSATEAADAKTGAPSGPGALVQQAREARGESVQEVADALHMLPRMVRALETEDWQALHSAAFVRGYYRAYAKWLELDPGAVVQAYNQLIGEDRPPQPEIKSATNAEVARRLQSGLSPWHLAGVVLALVLILLWWFWPSETESEAPVADDPVSETLSEATLAPPERSRPAMTVPGLDTDSDVAAPSAADDAAVPEASGGPVAEPPPSAAPASEPTPDQAELFAAAGSDSDIETPAGATRVTPTGSDELRLSFAEDCWVELRGPAGDRLYSDLRRPGDELVLVGAAPFQLLLGNAPAVDVRFNGEAVTIDSRSPGNVATLTLEP